MPVAQGLDPFSQAFKVNCFIIIIVVVVVVVVVVVIIIIIIIIIINLNLSYAQFPRELLVNCFIEYFRANMHTYLSKLILFLADRREEVLKNLAGPGETVLTICASPR